MNKRSVRNIIFYGLIFTFSALACPDARAGKADSLALYHFGVFDYEAGDYKSAESYINSALENDPGNPFYRHYLGRIAMKTERFEEAVSFLEKSWKTRRAIPGLINDLAYANFKTARYGRSAELYSEIAAGEPENTAAKNYAGFSFFKLDEYEKALDHFRLAEKKSEIRPDCRFLSGICLFKTGKIENALENFEYVRDHAGSTELKSAAIRWIEAVRNRESSRPYNLYCRVSGMYDGNVRLEPPGKDVYSDEEDYAVTVFLSGGYRFMDREHFRFNAGYSHYQSLYLELDEYNMTGAMPHIFADVEFSPFTFGLGYFPAWYWADSEDYLQRHRAVSKISVKPAERLNIGVSYSYSKDDYDLEEGRNGYVNEFFLDVSYNISENGPRLFGGAGFEDASTSHSDYEYFRIKAKLGLSVELPWELSFHFEGRYEDKKYDNEDSVYPVKRNDDKFSGLARLSRTLIPDLLAVSAEYSYTENDSNIIEKEYERNRGTIAFTVRY